MEIGHVRSVGEGDGCLGVKRGYAAACHCALNKIC